MGNLYSQTRAPPGNCLFSLTLFLFYLRGTATQQQTSNYEQQTPDTSHPHPPISLRDARKTQHESSFFNTIILFSKLNIYRVYSWAPDHAMHTHSAFSPHHPYITPSSPVPLRPSYRDKTLQGGSGQWSAAEGGKKHLKRWGDSWWPMTSKSRLCQTSLAIHIWSCRERRG